MMDIKRAEKKQQFTKIKIKVAATCPASILKIATQLLKGPRKVNPKTICPLFSAAKKVKHQGISSPPRVFGKARAKATWRE